MSIDSTAQGSDGAFPQPDASRADGTRRIARTAGIVALVALAVALVTVIVYAIEDHRTPGVVASADRTVAIGLIVASALAEAMSIAGHFLRHRAVAGRAIAVCGLIVAICAGLLLLLMWA